MKYKKRESFEIWDYFQVEMPTSNEEYENMINPDKITEGEKKLLTDVQLKELGKTWIVEWEFVYEDWKPIRFISIDDVNFIDVSEELFEIIDI